MVNSSAILKNKVDKFMKDNVHLMYTRPKKYRHGSLGAAGIGSKHSGAILKLPGFVAMFQISTFITVSFRLM